MLNFCAVLNFQVTRIPSTVSAKKPIIISSGQGQDSVEMWGCIDYRCMMGCANDYRLDGTCDEPRMDLRNASEFGALPKKAYMQFIQ